MSALTLLDPRIYQVQLEKLRRKARTRLGRREIESHGVSLSALGAEGPQLCRLVAREVREGTFRFGTLEQSRAWLDGKWRTLYHAGLVDHLVLSALSQRLTELNEVRLGDEVYSYRPGRSPWHAIECVQAYLAEYRRQTPLVRDRALWVLQRDVQAFGESIPTHDASRLWPLVRKLCSSADPVEARLLQRLCREASRPSIAGPGAAPTQLELGLPTGSPVQQPLENLYLVDLDEALRHAPGGLYLRFGDDLLFMTPSASDAERAAASMTQITTELGLLLKPSKCRNWYFTKPGRHPPQSVTTPALPTAPTPSIEYLGARIDFEGRLGLKRERVHELRKRWRRRIRNLVACARSGELSELQVVAMGLRASLTAREFQSDSATQALSDWVDDRHQLRALDFALRLDCAEALSGHRGVRAFRSISPYQLREAGLPSLEYQRRRSRGQP